MVLRLGKQSLGSFTIAPLESLGVYDDSVVAHPKS